MTPDQWIAALRAEGVTDIVEMPGWRTHNRGQRGGGWGDVHATMIHHTAGEGPGMPAYVYDGSSALPGPLCHDFLARSGRLYLVGNGRANHAGMVARNAYNAVLNEEAVHPAPGPDELDGNAVSYGLEVENSGAADRAWPAKQYDVAVRVQAARCRHHNWSANSVWAHKEATRRKPLDPRIPMDPFRADVAERLRHPASWNPGDTPTPEPEEEDMPLTDAEIDRIALRVLTYRNEAANRASIEATGKPIPDVYGYTAQTHGMTKAIGSKVDKLAQASLDDTQLNRLADLVAARIAANMASEVADKLAERLAE
ncbi:N-acetylmuramoyl-L-alanine amidase (plasmid) [Streptomyces sp. QHH-9511]|uniref:peptidoglycan recognition protein family protein n=1 Tax=Streptomyces sp. QHH-9511 TaxID=2684468 RepID=UPI001318EC6D|nr:N-acetylmuramoyl-L-alanine amidase [Streptomyces sp. QHH-9511]QGZ53377.1 N-acetylmuramoyl-L-alanine amidase [Streptomyces sp. QHH-9511]